MVDHALLDRLRKADSETWGRYTQEELGECVYSDDDGPITEYIDTYNLYDVAKDAWLQHVLQDAIRAKGWSSESIQTIRDDGIVIFLAWVTVYEIVKVYPHLGLGSKEQLEPDGSKMVRRHKIKQGAYGDSPAEALLKAYLTAIEDPQHAT